MFWLGLPENKAGVVSFGALQVVFPTEHLGKGSLLPVSASASGGVSRQGHRRCESLVVETFFYDATFLLSDECGGERGLGDQPNFTVKGEEEQSSQMCSKVMSAGHV